MGLILVIIGAVELINLGLRVYVFPQADMVRMYPSTAQPTITDGEKPVVVDQEKQRVYEEELLVSNRQREITNALALLIVGIPLFGYHWRLIRKEK